MKEMMPLRWALPLLLAFFVTYISAAVHEQLSAIPHGWSPLPGTAEEATGAATFTIALKQNCTNLETLLLDVSTPGSPQYGHYLTKKEVDSRFPVNKNVVADVTAWLKSHEISNYRVDGSFIDFVSDIPTANKLLNASYQYYHPTNNKQGVRKLRTLRYTIPDSMQKHIALIDPGTYFGKTSHFSVMRSPTSKAWNADSLKGRDAASPSKTTVDASCQASITPACLRQMYNVGDYVPDPKSGSRIGFGSFLNGSAIYDDLFQFEDYNKIPRQNFTKVSVANGTFNQNTTKGGFGEADLDVQNIIGIAHPLPVVEYSTGGSPPFIPTLGQPTPAGNGNEPYVPYYRYLLGLENEELPQVISNSYGDQEDGVPFNYAELTCDLIGLLSLRGITNLFSSGDSGVGDGCLAPDFKTVEFIPSFPATCPYVTAVGGTVAVTPEVAWNLSTGGFSSYFPRPCWQEATLKKYLQTEVTNETFKYYAAFTNWSGRAFPDVAAHSLTPDFQVVYAGKLDGSGGTSAASPVWAAIVGLLNDARLRAGKPALGWLNPLLYLAGAGRDALIDITDGYAVGCLPPSQNGSGVVLGARWNATVGWDPVTGWGTPDFPRLKDFVLKI